jgi:Spy/CpxP family protein refolding chaperone
MGSAKKDDRLSRRVVLGLAAIAAGIGGSFVLGGATASSSQAAGWFRRHRRHHRPWGHGGWHRLEPEEMRKRAHHAARWLLRTVDATPQQEEQVQQRVDSLVDELIAVRAQMPDRRAQFVEQLTAPTIDRAALHQAREAGMKQAARAWTLAVDAFADIAEVLTPEQRAQLRAEIEEHRHWS